MDIGNIIKTMNDRGLRKAVTGAPFYAPPKRKTSAEIISEARAAVYGESDESGASSGAGSGALRPLRTRRPFTPQESQRTLFADRSRRKEPRPPSAFKLKNVSENGEQVWSKSVDSGLQAAGISDFKNEGPMNDTHASSKKKSRNSRGVGNVQERSSQEDHWNGYTKLPNLSGRTKQLHRRNSTHHELDSISKDSKKELDELASAIQITQSFPIPEFDSLKSTPSEGSGKKHCTTGSKRSQYVTKSWSCDTVKKATLDEDILVKHINSADKKRSHVSQSMEHMTVLELSECLLQRSRDSERNKQLLSALAKAIEQNSCASNVREMAIRALYTHVDTEDAENQVNIARAMFMLRVTGPHLATACKLVFKVAKHDKNDHFFKNTNLLELLVEGMALCHPVSDSEVVVYGAGAVRVVAGGGGGLGGRAASAGAVHLLGLHLKIINDAKSSRPSSPNEQLSHALYQITGALRNLAGGDTSAFLHAGVLNDILVGLHVHKTDRDVLTNLVRCLSVVSTSEPCLSWLCGGGGGGGSRRGAGGAVVRAAGEVGRRGGLLVRLLYVLGNMAAHHHSARTNIYEEDNSVDILLTIIESYTDRSERMDARDIELEHDTDNDMIGSRGTNEDVLIKAVRVFANLCLSEREGRSLAKNHFSRIGNALLRCLNIARRKQQQSDLEDDVSEMDRREELATASLATLNNVTYYRDADVEVAHEDYLIDQLCQETCRWVAMYSSPASCEAVRALGNLTRSSRAAVNLVRTGAVSALEPFLRHEEVSVRCGAAGVLVNVCGSGAGAGAGEGVVRAAGEGVEWAAGEGDAPLAALLLRALWNLHSHTPLHPASAAKVADAIHVFIDDDSVFAPCEAQRSTSSDRRRASDPDLSKHQVKFNVNNNEEYPKEAPSNGKMYKTLSVSVDQDLNMDRSWDDEGCSGEDLGFEEGELVGDDGCDCTPCRRLAEWDELVAVAIPLLEKLKPVRSDVAVGTEI